MWIPFPFTSPSLSASSSPSAVDGSGLSWTIAPPHPSTISPNTSNRTQSISFLLPLIIIGVFLAITGSTLLIARCLYRRIKTLHVTNSNNNGTASSTWKSFYTSNRNNGDYEDEETGASNETDRLLDRRQSTSYFNTNRSRAPVPVVIRNDAKGRPISTWSTASSVAAQRGEELSKWSKRRDDLIKIYGRSQLNTSSFIGGSEDLEEGEEQELQQQEDDDIEVDGVREESSGDVQTYGREEHQDRNEVEVEGVEEVVVNDGNVQIREHEDEIQAQQPVSTHARTQEQEAEQEHTRLQQLRHQQQLHEEEQRRQQQQQEKEIVEHQKWLEQQQKLQEQQQQQQQQILEQQQLQQQDQGAVQTPTTSEQPVDLMSTTVVLSQ
ncbi:hypothetical protein BGZ83_002562 [Gryganskiella cystojenkinii]|nr:hypothetical protein BGZ83_002562 [Gryganskiella cystojenkinii]